MRLSGGERRERTSCSRDARLSRSSYGTIDTRRCRRIQAETARLMGSSRCRGPARCSESGRSSTAVSVSRKVDEATFPFRWFWQIRVRSVAHTSGFGTGWSWRRPARRDRLDRDDPAGHERPMGPLVARSPGGPLFQRQLAVARQNVTLHRFARAR